MRSDGAEDGEAPDIVRREGIPLDAAGCRSALADQLARDTGRGTDLRVASGPRGYAADRPGALAQDGVGAGWLAPASQLPPIGSSITRQHRVELSVPTARLTARFKGRVGLTMLNWHGSVPDALQVLSVLVDNALQHSGPPKPADAVLRVCLGITEPGQLLVDVEDFSPTFADFQDVRAGIGDGLLVELVRSKAITDLTWFVSPEFKSKTVRAVLTAGVVEP